MDEKTYISDFASPWKSCCGKHASWGIFWLETNIKHNNWILSVISTCMKRRIMQGWHANKMGLQLLIIFSRLIYLNLLLFNVRNVRKEWNMSIRAPRDQYGISKMLILSNQEPISLINELKDEFIIAVFVIILQLIFRDNSDKVFHLFSYTIHWLKAWLHFFMVILRHSVDL